MTGVPSAQQGPFGVAAALTRPAEKPGARARLRVDDSTQAELGRALPHRISPPPARRQNSEQDQSIEPRVAAATLLEASLIAAALIDTDETDTGLRPPRTTPWQPPSSSLPLRDRSA